MKKSVSRFVPLLILCSLLVTLPRINIVKASETIYIRADGSVEGTDKIQRDGNTYTFTGDVFDSIVVEKDDVVIDGAGYTLQEAEGGGIVLSERNNVTIKNVKIEIEGGDGIYLVDASNCIVSGNNITGDSYAIQLWRSFNNTVEGNTVTNSFRGILVYDSYNNTITGNNLTNNRVGIELHDCFNNVLRNNQMNNNSRNFSILWYPSYRYVNDVDTSNTVDGAPIYYWVNERDRAVPSDAGCVILVNCTRIAVQNLNLSRNGQSILLVSTTNSTITKNTIMGSGGSQGIGFIYSSNNYITGNNVQNQSTGIQLGESSNNIISGNNVAHNDRGIRPLYSSKHNTISGNNITANDYGIDDIQEPSGNNIISGNNITANNFGISLRSSNNIISENNVIANTAVGIILSGGSNTLVGNNITNNGDGIYLSSSNNVLRNNRMENNSYNFNVGRGFVNDVDASNTVEGKPIYYWVYQYDKTVPSDAGYVVLVNCKNITVEKLILSYNGEGILLAFTKNSIITQNILKNMSAGIRFYGSSNNLIIGNDIKNNKYGLYFSGGGFLSTYYPSPNNIILNNNFIDNQEAVYDIAEVGTPWIPVSGPPVNIWDNGEEGNYWSDYTGWDANGDGIGDTPYVINAENQDHYPLMKPFNISAIIIPEIPDTTPPTISIISPENRTYTVTAVPLTFTVSEFPSWISYSLDGQANNVIAGNTTLTGLSDGMHTLTVYATVFVYPWTKDTFGNMGSETIYFTIDTTSPIITILSPGNRTYDTTDIPLNFTATETTSWIGYSLDRQANATITGNTTLTELSDGSHSLTVYATDTAGNTGTSETIHFSIAQKSEPFSTWVVVAIVIVALVGVALLVYIRKIRKTTGEIRRTRPEGVM